MLSRDVHDVQNVPLEALGVSEWEYNDVRDADRSALQLSQTIVTYSLCQYIFYIFLI